MIALLLKTALVSSMIAAGAVHAQVDHHLSTEQMYTASSLIFRNRKIKSKGILLPPLRRPLPGGFFEMAGAGNGWRPIPSLRARSLRTLLLAIAIPHFPPPLEAKGDGKHGLKDAGAWAVPH